MKPARAFERRLLWNADDFGLSGPVNEGIALAHTQGMLSGASILAGGESFEGAVRLARTLPRMDLGVHLAAVGVRAVLPAGANGGLSDTGGLLPPDYPAFLKRFLLRRISLPGIEAEWEAQIARVRDSGLQPAYLDSHQHLHVLPALFEITLRLMDRFGIHAVRTPGDVVVGRPGPARKILLSGLFQLGARARVLARRRGHVTPDGTLGIGDAGHLSAELLKSFARVLPFRPPGTWEIVGHPGMGEPAGSPWARWGYAWQEELAAARDEDLKAAWAAAGVRRVAYRDLGGS